MALRNLVENQCGEGNPLIKLANHMVNDKTHQEYRQAWYPHHEEIRHDVDVLPDQLVNDFINETKMAAVTKPQAFRMDTLLQEMHDIEKVPPLLGPGVAVLASDTSTWANEFFDSETFIQEVLPGENWTREFLEGNVRPSQKFDSEALWNQALESSKQDTLDRDSELAETANKLLGTLDNTKLSNTEFRDYMKGLSNVNTLHDLKFKAADTHHSWANEFLSYSTSPELKVEATSFNNISQKNLDHKAWEKEFSHDNGNANIDIDSEQMSSKEREDFWQQLQDTWEKAASEQKESDHPWFHEFEEEAVFKDYAFKDENPLRDHPNPLAEGKKCLEKGDLPSAVLLFEAAVQKESNNSEAWLLLGTTHAENEQDPSAIPALRKGLELDPLNLDGWISLATSYTNESYQTYACYALKDWIKNNSVYKHLIGPQSDIQSQHPKILVATLAPRELVDEVQSLYIRAANLRLDNKIDCDVQCGLGILLNLTGEYEKAIDCFQSAIRIKPNDARLWNKLGATLANSSRSAEAIESYRSALEISPGFIRCRYNLGVACINLGAHREAMEHFLEALNMQERGRGLQSKGSSLAVSDNIWSTLRVCLRSLNREYLMAAVHNRDLKTLNKEFGGDSFGSS